MTVGEKIKRIRTFRGLTQQELGIAVGFDKKGADNRIAQYEINYRIPKKNLLEKIAKALNVSCLNFFVEESGSATDIIETFFWMDEDNPNAIHLFQLTKISSKKNYTNDTAIRYYDSDDWPAHAPIGIWFGYNTVNQFMQEWLSRKQELKTGLISKEEYFEWKINWPETTDSCGKFEPKIKWRK